MNTFQFKRSDRVSHEIKDILSRIISSVIQVKGSGLVTITKVKTADNLRFSRIYLSFINNTMEIDEIIKAMNISSRDYRYHLGKEIELKYIPQIKFYHDDTFIEMEKINSLINKANNK